MAQTAKNDNVPEVCGINKLRRSTTTALTTSHIEEMHNKLQKSSTLSSVGKTTKDCDLKTAPTAKNANVPEVCDINKLRKSTTTTLTTSHIEEMHNELQKSSTLSSVENTTKNLDLKAAPKAKNVDVSEVSEINKQRRSTIIALTTSHIEEMHNKLQKSSTLSSVENSTTNRDLKTAPTAKNVDVSEVSEMNKLRRSTTTTLTTSHTEQMHNKLQKSLTLSSVVKTTKDRDLKTQKPPLPFLAGRKTIKSNATESTRPKSILKVAERSARSTDEGVSSSSAASEERQIANSVKVENSSVKQSSPKRNEHEAGGKHFPASPEAEKTDATAELEISSKKVLSKQIDATSTVKPTPVVPISKINDGSLEKKMAVEKTFLKTSNALNSKHTAMKIENNSLSSNERVTGQQDLSNGSRDSVKMKKTQNSVINSESKTSEFSKELKENVIKADKETVIKKIDKPIECSVSDLSVVKEKCTADDKIEKIKTFCTLDEKNVKQVGVMKYAAENLKGKNETNASSAKTHTYDSSLKVCIHKDERITESLISQVSSTALESQAELIQENALTSPRDIRQGKFDEIEAVPINSKPDQIVFGENHVNKKPSASKHEGTGNFTKKNIKKDSSRLTLQETKVVEQKGIDYRNNLAETTKSKTKLKAGKNDTRVTDNEAIEKDHPILSSLESKDHDSVQDCNKDKEKARTKPIFGVLEPSKLSASEADHIILPPQIPTEVQKHTKEDVSLLRDVIPIIKKEAKFEETKRNEKTVKVEISGENVNGLTKIHEARTIKTVLSGTGSVISSEKNTELVDEKLVKNVKNTVPNIKLEKSVTENNEGYDRLNETESTAKGNDTTNGDAVRSKCLPSTVEKTNPVLTESIGQSLEKKAFKIKKSVKIIEGPAKQPESPSTTATDVQCDSPLGTEKSLNETGAKKVKKKKIQTEGGTDKVKKKKKKKDQIIDETNQVKPLNSDAAVVSPASENTGDISTTKDLPKLRKVDDITESAPKPSLDDLWCDYANSTASSQQKIITCVGNEQKGYSVEDFHLLKVLGRGSYGKVMLAELKGKKQYFAIKCLRKDVVLEDNDVECTMIEKEVLAMGSIHPYLCTLFCTFQSEAHLFFVMEYLSGGDLMFHIQQSGRFPQDRARFYAAEIACALKYLHKTGIIYRDAKLDNICIDADGHVRLVDFGFCKLRIYRKECLPRNLCGTPDYMAPEIIKGYHYNQSVDWWSFGVLLYEMLVGYSPFNGSDEEELFWSVCNEEVVYPRFLSKEATQILVLLLNKDPEKRLGMPGCTGGDMYCQPFFRPIDWIKAERKQLEPPFKPNLNSETDVSNFDSDFTMEKATLTPIDKIGLNSIDQELFSGFTYTNPLLLLD